MNMTAAQLKKIDPLHALIAGGFVSGTKHPLPLVATRYDVDLNHGLAVVTATRIFRNAEESSIEATITFPMPVHAVLFNLEARIDGSVLKARAQRRGEARATYEVLSRVGRPLSCTRKSCVACICCRLGTYPLVQRSRYRQPGQ
jgi:hypothetical protein